MKNKGFTLVELLGIIVLMLIMVSFTFPSLNKLLKERPEMQYKAFLTIIQNAGESYVEKYYDDFDFSIKDTFYVSVKRLIIEDYIKDNLANPKTEKGILEENGYVQVTKNSDNSLSYDYTNFDINNPTLPENMIPVYYDETCNSGVGCWRKADSSNYNANALWHDYANGIWANAVTVRALKTETPNSHSRQEYLDAKPGMMILDDDILTFFVWIPRYEYKTSSLNNYAGVTQATPGAMDIHFLSGTQKESSNEYKINNAFIFDNKELEGIWVGKFATSTGDVNATTPQPLYIKPNQIYWSKANISTSFTSARRMELSGNIYGFSQSGSATVVTTNGAGTYGNIANDNNKIDTHLMKNSEWGAVAYLSQSIFGRCISKTNCPEIAQNNSTSFYTGRSSGRNATTSAEGSYVYNAKEGFTSSTTGNVYGIYDMVGGTWNIVMGNYNTNTNKPTALTTPGSSGFSTSNYPNNKYIDYYNNPNTNCGNNGNCYGHALSETSGWYNDYSDFTKSSVSTSPWLTRGGSFTNTSANSGLFMNGNGNGGTGAFYVVLVNI